MYSVLESSIFFQHDYFGEALEDTDVFAALVGRRLKSASQCMNMTIPYEDIRKVVNMCLQYAKYKRATSNQVSSQELYRDT